MAPGIYTLTLNPALDLAVWVQELVPNEKNYVDLECWYPGGNGVNVARILSRLKVPATAMGFLGSATGERFRTLLREEKVKHDFVSIQGETRMNVTVSTTKDPSQTRLSFPGPHIRPPELRKLSSLLRRLPAGSILVTGGSLPPNISPAMLRKILSALQKRGIRLCVDVPGKQLRSLVPLAPFLIKPNLTEFQEFAGTGASSIREVGRIARKHAERIPLVCVSSVEGGTLLVSREQAWFGRIPKVKLRSTVGAGDSMVAAMVGSIWGAPDGFERRGAEILRLGLAAACATLVQPGTQLGSRADIRRFHRLSQVREISLG
jgi:1-phosphofructokinase family hexose kinase